MVFGAKEVTWGLEMKVDAPAPAAAPKDTGAPVLSVTAPPTSGEGHESGDDDLEGLQTAKAPSTAKAPPTVLERLRISCDAMTKGGTFEKVLKAFESEGSGVPKAALKALFGELGLDVNVDRDLASYSAVLFALASEDDTAKVCLGLTQAEVARGDQQRADVKLQRRKSVALGTTEKSGKVGSLKDVKIKDKVLQSLMEKVAKGEREALDDVKSRIEYDKVLFQILQDSAGDKPKYKAGEAVNQVAKFLQLLHKGLQLALSSSVIDDEYVVEMREKLSLRFEQSDGKLGPTLLVEALCELVRIKSDDAVKLARNLILQFKDLKLALWPAEAGMDNHPLIKVLEQKLDMLNGKVGERLVDLLLKKDVGLDMFSASFDQSRYLKALLVLYNDVSKGGAKAIEEKEVDLWFGDKAGDYYPLLIPSVLSQASALGGVRFLDLFAYSGDFYSLSRAINILIESDSSVIEKRGALASLEGAEDRDESAISAARDILSAALDGAMERVFEFTDAHGYSMLHYLAFGKRFHLLFKGEAQTVIEGVLAKDLTARFYDNIKAKLCDQSTVVSLSPGDESATTVNLLQFVKLATSQGKFTLKKGTFKAVTDWLGSQGVSDLQVGDMPRGPALKSMNLYFQSILGGLHMIVKSYLTSWDDMLRETFPAKGAPDYDTFSVELLSKLQALEGDSESQEDFRGVDALVFLSSYTKNFLTVGYGPYLWHGEGEAVSKFKTQSIGMLLPDSVLFGEGHLPVKCSTDEGEVQLSFWHAAAASCDEILMSRAVKKAAAEDKLGELLTYEVGEFKASFLHYLFTSTRVTYQQVVGFLEKLAEAINASVELSDDGLTVQASKAGDADDALLKQHDPIFAGEGALEEIKALFTGSKCTRPLDSPEDAPPGLLQYILAREQLYKWKAGKVVDTSKLSGGKGVLAIMGKLMKVVGESSGLTPEEINTALGEMRDEFDGYSRMWKDGSLSRQYGEWTKAAFEGSISTNPLFDAVDDVEFLVNETAPASSDSSEFSSET